ncbi:MAG: hypothetical protein JSW27_25030 [Phycisphaerales bacterium]|nr:MAG: hypothetical protein JSW27_25030 [Phycisphaerales bacterium]
MAPWIVVAVPLMLCVVVGVVGWRKNSGVMMVAAGAWALFLVGCGFVVGFDDAFVLFGFPLIGAFGVTILDVGLKALLKDS